MKIFLAFCLLCLAFLSLWLFRPVGVPEAVVVPESVSVVAPYDHGYARGYASFLRQMGEDVPMPVAVRYVVEDGHDVGEEEMRGYVDGYHRAADRGVCPR